MTLQELATKASADFNAEYTKNLNKVKDYAETGLLEGLEGTDAIHMAVLLDNQMKRLISESVSMTNQGGSTFNGSAGEQTAQIILPMVRKVFADTISAKEFVSIQPLSLPSGLIFYLDFKYGTNKSPFAQGDSVYGNTNTYNTAPTGGLYGAGRFGYSFNQISASGTSTISSASWADVYLKAELSGSVQANEIKKVAVPLSAIPDYDEYALSTFGITGGGVTTANTFAQYTTRDSNNIYFFVSGTTAGITSATVAITYSKQTRDNFRGDYEDRTGTLNIADYNIEFVPKTIVAKSRKLRGSWTPEASMDIQKYQGINLEAELTSMMADSIGRDMDLEVLSMLGTAVRKGGSETFWSAENNMTINTAKTAYVPLASGFFNSQGDWFSTLGTKINGISNQILQKIVRGSANFMVISPNVANVVESMAGYMSDADVDKTVSSFGANRAGVFNSQYKVFKNAYYTEDKVLMGFKGNNYLEAGAVVAPYVPLETTPNMFNPQTGTPTKIMSTRYGREVLRPEFYGAVTVGGLNTVI